MKYAHPHEVFGFGVVPKPAKDHAQEGLASSINFSDLFI